MGSMITLGIGKMEIDWGKNNIFTNHACLFQKDDLKIVPYYYSNDTIEYKEGFSKNLLSVKRRLDILGYSLSKIEDMFNEQLQYANKLLDTSIPISYSDYYNAVRRINIANIDMTSEQYDYMYDLGEYVKNCVLENILNLNTSSDDYTSEFLENIPVYITLRILAENASNHTLDLVWRFSDLIEDGYITIDDIAPQLSNKEKILIVTEGSSDSDIIKKSIDTLYDDISDFFEFIDMKDNYPFTGTGSLNNFIKGLAKIHILNNIIVVLDNDTAGNSVYNTIKDLSLPNNFKVLTLPNHKEFEHFKCLGPQGESYENINGKAVSIECFLDHSFYNNVVYIRWTSYDNKQNQYQGNIEPKDLLVKSFHEHYEKAYDFSKLRHLIDSILEHWIN